jgi:hypothetical protein
VKLFLKFIVGIFLIVGLIIILFLLNSSIQKTKNEKLFLDVDSKAQEVFNNISLPDELVDEQEVHKFGCDYDHKVNTTRCNTFYIKYFANNNPTIEEFFQVDKYIVSLGWTYSYEDQRSPEHLQSMLDDGFAPTNAYKINNKYGLDMLLKFYSSKEIECRYSCSDKISHILDKYGDKYKTIYSITISTDFINR